MQQTKTALGLLTSYIENTLGYHGAAPVKIVLPSELYNKVLDDLQVINAKLNQVFDPSTGKVKSNKTPDDFFFYQGVRIVRGECEGVAKNLVAKN